MEDPCLELGFGARLEIAESAEDSPLIAGVSGVASGIVYSVYNGVIEQTSDFYRYRFADGRVQRIAADVAANQISYDGRRAVTTVTEKLGNGPGRAQDDIYQIAPGEIRPITDDNQSVSPQLYRGTLMWISGKRIQVEQPGTGEVLTPHSGDINAPALGDGFVTDVTNRDGNYEVKLWTVETNPRSAWLDSPRGTHSFGIVAATGSWVSWIAAPGGDPLNGSVLLQEKVSVN